MLRISLVQTESRPGEPQANLALAREAAARAEGRVVVFPELFNAGYDLSVIDSIPEAALADFRGGLAALSRETGKIVISGCLARGARKFRNEAVVFREGAEAACYTKVHLCQTPPVDEMLHFEAGDAPVVVDIDGWRCGLAICYDLRFPALFQAYRRLGADAIILISAWPVERWSHWYTLLRARAIENQCYVLACGMIGAVPAATFCGASLGFDPWGNPLAEADCFSPKIVETALVRAEIERYRPMHPIGRHERLDLYGDWLRLSERGRTAP
ncbi:MAG: nitrilase-related carbon-nitrogen hydrolase [Rhodospirillaceae bacterium]